MIMARPAATAARRTRIAIALINMRLAARLCAAKCNRKPDHPTGFRACRHRAGDATDRQCQIGRGSGQGTPGHRFDYSCA